MINDKGEYVHLIAEIRSRTEKPLPKEIGDIIGLGLNEATVWCSTAIDDPKVITHLIKLLTERRSFTIEIKCH